MNDKLIKQLKSVGFERTESRFIAFLTKVIKGKTFKYNYTTDNFWQKENITQVDIWGPSFEQIVAAVKKHTGVDLQPKQTKTQRIAELENQTEVLTTNLQKVEDMIKDKSLIVDENTKAINKNKELIKQEVNDLNSLRALVLEINARLNKLERNNSLDVAQKVLETTKEIGNLALELKKLDMQDGGFIEKKEESDGRVLAKAEGNENILTKKQAEALTNKPKFKVGDKVVLKKDVVIESDFDCTGLKIGQEKGTVWTIESFKDFNMVHIVSGYSAWMTKVSYLEHAPKLKLGAWAEIIGKTGDHFFKIGEKVLIGALDVEEGYVCSTADTWYYVKKEDLKPL